MAEHISSAEGRLCWDNTSYADHEDSLFKMVFDDPDEIYFVTMTSQLQYYGKIGITNTRGVSQVM